jgi:hypothetical protein
MRGRNPAELRRWLPAAALVALTACHAPAPRETAPERVPPPAARPPVDASYDWHVLVIAPFGSVLKDIPLRLHEVLLFRDETPGAAAAEDAECYAPDDPAPRFIDSAPEEYLLCFKHDRLARIRASVRLAPAQAAEVFAAACADWHAGPNDGACNGSDAAARFSARLDDESLLSMVLDVLPE